MQTHIYAMFNDPQMAEKAAGALLDKGVQAADLTVIQHRAPEHHEVMILATPSPTVSGQTVAIIETSDVTPETQPDVENDAKHGLTTTTAGDAVLGAAKGAGLGIGLGTLAALASMFIPGVGLVFGGGALAMAIAGAAATTGAGVVAGAVTGYLVDQGVDEMQAIKYEEVLQGGGAVIVLALPSGHVDEPLAWEVIDKYAGTAYTQHEAMNATY